MEPLALAYLHFRGARRQQDFLSVKELGQRLRDGRSALTGHLVDEAVGLFHDVLFLGGTAFKLNMARKKILRLQIILILTTNPNSNLHLKSHIYFENLL